MLEELGIEYDAFVIPLNGPQFSTGFVKANPNSKIPAAIDLDGPDGRPISLFESASIVLYLAEKYGKFVPANVRGRTECMNWLFWQMAGQGPMTGNFGHFMVYAPAELDRDYGVARYGMEVQRLCSVLDNHLQNHEYMAGGEYSIADMVCLPWFQAIRGPKTYLHPSGVGAQQFLSVDKYRYACAWADRLMQRPQVQRGMAVCRGLPKPWEDAEKWPKMLASIMDFNMSPLSKL